MGNTWRFTEVFEKSEAGSFRKETEKMDIVLLILLAIVIALLLVILVRMPKRQSKGAAQEPSAMLLMQQNISELGRENAQTLRNITQELHDAGERGTRGTILK